MKMGGDRATLYALNGELSLRGEEYLALSSSVFVPSRPTRRRLSLRFPLRIEIFQGVWREIEGSEYEVAPMSGVVTLLNDTTATKLCVSGTCILARPVVVSGLWSVDVQSRLISSGSFGNVFVSRMPQIEWFATLRDTKILDSRTVPYQVEAELVSEVGAYHGMARTSFVEDELDLVGQGGLQFVHGA